MDTSAVSLRLSRETPEDARPKPAVDARLIRACNWLLDMLLDEDDENAVAAVVCVVAAVVEPDPGSAEENAIV